MIKRIKEFDPIGDVKRGLIKKLMPKLIAKIKPGLLGVIASAKEYTDTIKLEPGEVTAMGLVFLDEGKAYISLCTMRKSDNGKLGVSRKLQQYDLDDVANLVIVKLGQMDMSELLTKLENE